MRMLNREWTYPVKELLAEIESNRQEHMAVYEVAQEKYLKAAEEWYKESLRLVYLGKVRRQMDLPKPECHAKDYDQVIEMLKMTCDKEIKLSATEFSMFVMDDWDWKEEWKISNAAYGVG